ncbi:hypothetical protein EHS25_001706 [Saitozyma podzolica]|uniref:Uncharacterized protein n=1 Tax=Saitozyma podzolica TaxID=1890683 RepID=A0A427YEX5_9TREE|nr:hypothetical protein EHS25_001706 [Saitozyma podzolica]
MVQYSSYPEHVAVVAGKPGVKSLCNPPLSYTPDWDALEESPGSGSVLATVTDIWAYRWQEHIRAWGLSGCQRPTRTGPPLCPSRILRSQTAPGPAIVEIDDPTSPHRRWRALPPQCLPPHPQTPQPYDPLRSVPRDMQHHAVTSPARALRAPPHRGPWLHPGAYDAFEGEPK